MKNAWINWVRGGIFGSKARATRLRNDERRVTSDERAAGAKTPPVKRRQLDEGDVEREAALADRLEAELAAEGAFFAV